VLKTRAMQPRDVEKVKQLHQRYYPQFDFPDFYQLMCGFIIEDENDEIVIAGGVEAIGEAKIVTNQGRSNITIGKALVDAQRAAYFICQQYGIRELLAFVDNPSYAKHLVQHGFVPREEEVLSLRIRNGKEETGTSTAIPRRIQ
jgi:hypothetical protein